MLRIITGLIAAAVLVAVAWLLAGLPGHVTASVGDYAFDASAPAVGLGLLLLFALIYVVIRLISSVIALPRVLRRRRQNRSRHHGDAAVTRTLLALAAGDHGDARREASRARRLLGDTPQTLLLAAEAGRLGGREAEAETAFRLLAEHKEASFLGLAGLLRQAMAREDWAEAAALANKAEAAHPGAAWLRTEREQLAVRTGAWTEALSLAPDEAPKAAYAAAAAELEPDPVRALRLARRAWKQDRALVPAALAFARRQREQGQPGRAAETIRSTWAINPHPDLAEFLLAPLTDKIERLREARRLAQENPSHLESRLAVAAAALEAGELREAREQAEAARDSGFDQRRLWLLLARVEEEERGDTEEGRAAHRELLRRAAAAPADPVWRCEHCGTALRTWSAACPSCGTPGRVAWGSGLNLHRIAG